jgi:hypothetical protein
MLRVDHRMPPRLWFESMNSSETLEQLESPKVFGSAAKRPGGLYELDRTHDNDSGLAGLGD